jgi:hypothetical protein
MEFVAYVSIGVGCFSVIMCILGLIYKSYDDKRQKRMEQEASSQ